MSPSHPFCRPARHLAIAIALGLVASAAGAAGAEHGAVAHEPAAPAKAAAVAPAPTGHAAPKAAPTAAPPAAGDPQLVADRIRAAMARRPEQEKVQVLVGNEVHTPRSTQVAAVHTSAPRHRAKAPAHGAASHDETKARVAAMAGHPAPSAHGGDPHWSYQGEYGPDNWASVKPEFNACAVGKRQSPVHIEGNGTLQGPAEPLKFDYRPTGGTVVNNGHTIQVDLEPGNTLTVRGATYQLLQFHFHHPSEEKVNYKGFSMVAHLVHKNYEGQLAVVAVLIDPGVANTLIHKVWTHMPLDSGDRVRLPAGLVDLRELLPQDQRYFQFMGSLTTPPCTEGVLWNVLKQPVSVSPEQLQLFARLFPMNARPVQALNGRVVREAQ